MIKKAMSLFLVPAFLCVSAVGGWASYESFDAAYSAARAKFQLHDYSAAQEAFAAALELAQDHSQRGRARIGLAECMLASQDGDGCRKLAEETLEDSYGKPSWPQAYALRLIAESYHREQRLDEMQSILDRVDIFPGGSTEGYDDFVRLGVASMLQQAGMAKESRELYQTVEDSGGNYKFWSMYWLARMDFESGNLEEARVRVTNLRGQIPENAQQGGEDLRQAVESMATRLGTND